MMSATTSSPLNASSSAWSSSSSSMLVRAARATRRAETGGRWVGTAEAEEKADRAKVRPALGGDDDGAPGECAQQ